MSSFESDVKDIALFQTTQAETLENIGRMKRAVTNMQDAVNSLPVRGDYATQWFAAVAAFNQVAELAKKNADNLAQKVSAHGRNTDTANVVGSEVYARMAQAAQAGLV